jgi:hypothetical protein
VRCPEWCRSAAAYVWAGLIAVGANRLGALPPPPTGLQAEHLLWRELEDVHRLLPLLAEADRPAPRPPVTETRHREER